MRRHMGYARSDAPIGTTASSPVVNGWTGTAPARWAVVLLAVGGTLTGVVLAALAYTSDGLTQPGLHAALASWITIPYIAAGLIAWRRRPDSRLGVLMIIAGFASFLSFLTWSNNDALYTLGLATQFLPPVLFLHVFLAFPSGRLDSRLDRAVVMAAYGAAALTIPVLALAQESPRNVVALVVAPQVADVVQRLQLLVVSALSLAGIAVLAHRRRLNGRPLRTALGVLVDAFSLGLLMIALLLLAGLLEWTSIQETVRLMTFAVIGVAPIVFLIGLLAAQLGRASVADLLVDLGVNPGPGELQHSVARALRDPSARVAYWVEEFDAYADIDGRQTDVSPRPGRSATPIVREGAPVAMLLHDEALDDEPELLSSVAAATGMTIHNAQLQVELRARLEELRGSRMRILQAERRERRRLERDLHDGAQQRLVALSLELGEMAELVIDEELRKRVDAARTEVSASLADLRDLAHGIHPATVSDHGLMVALESLATHATVPVRIEGVVVGRLPEAVELGAFFVVSEALANIAKHADASSAVVTLDRRAASLRVEVSDDGVGGATTEGGTGLRGLADRMEALGGRLRVWSTRGHGTLLRAEIPCEP
jgi:signal transduction histidine kinase